MRIAFAVRVKFETLGAIPWDKFRTTTTASDDKNEEICFTFVQANIATDCNEKDCNAFQEAAKTACEQAVEYVRKEHTGARITKSNVIQFQVLE